MDRKARGIDLEETGMGKKKVRTTDTASIITALSPTEIDPTRYDLYLIPPMLLSRFLGRNDTDQPLNS